MQLIKVLIACLIATPAMAHHEGATTSSFDTTVVALIGAAALLAAVAFIKAQSQSKKAVLKINASENEK